VGKPKETRAGIFTKAAKSDAGDKSSEVQLRVYLASRLSARLQRGKVSTEDQTKYARKALQNHEARGRRKGIGAGSNESMF